jgi:class 3 adenylate cyclase
MYLKRNVLTLRGENSTIKGEKLDVVVVYADLRGFAQWSLQSPATEITSVIEVIYNRVIQLAFFYRHTFHKFLGDGFLLIWEVNDHGSLSETLRWAIAAAFEIHKKYWYIARDMPFPPPPGFGIGISCGEVIRIDPNTIIPELNEPDFVGYPMNSGARLQKLAGPYGTVIDSLGVTEALVHKDRILREDNAMLRLRLVRPHDKALTLARTFSGLHDDDILGFRYVTWPYVMEALWKHDGRI